MTALGPFELELPRAPSIWPILGSGAAYTREITYNYLGLWIWPVKVALPVLRVG